MNCSSRDKLVSNNLSSRAMHALARIPRRSHLFFIAMLATRFADSFVFAADSRLEFNRDIRPILSDQCFSCHGPDEKTRHAGLRLDLPDSAQAKLESGHVAIVPGKPDASELVRRIQSTDPDVQMPPPDSTKQLTPEQRELLQRWISQGAEYQKHWAFVAPKRPVVDGAGQDVAGPIDIFIRDRLKKEGLSPAAPATREQLIRRVTLDLTGTPPSILEIDEFLKDESPDAFEKLVDRLQASPRYGERLTLDWLDAARFADTHGFNNDTTRSMWRWRDWTIDAFNGNMPFDQFVTEQLGGDLLPNPSLEQQIATGFNRNHVINSEGGIIPEEYRVEYVADRVHTTATIFLGLSMGCARCHDHKFDPISQREFYQFFAFFNQLDEKGEAGRVGNAEPMIPAPTPDQQKRQSWLNREIETVDQAVADRISKRAAALSEWESRLQEASRPREGEPFALLRFTFNDGSDDQVKDMGRLSHHGKIVGKVDRVAGKLDRGLKFDGNTHVEVGDVASFERSSPFAIAAWINAENRDAGTIVAKTDASADFRGFGLQISKGKLSAAINHRRTDNSLQVITKNEIPINVWKHVAVTYDGSSKAEGLKLYVDGQLQEVEIKSNQLTESVVTEKPLRIGRRGDESPFKGVIDDVRIDEIELSPAMVRAVADEDGLRDLIAIKPEDRSAEQVREIARISLARFDTEFQSLSQRRISLDQDRRTLDKQIPSAMVMKEMPQPRQTFVLKRGQYDAPADEVQPGVPASLPPFPNDAPRNRLGLAKWLLDPNHPLTARVAVNRSWALFFGTGLVETVEDFGSQGMWPTHLDLLDWLAVEFSGSDGGVSNASTDRPRWDVKRLHRLMVTSETYRQSSRITAEHLERDPANKLLARGPRFRLQAEAIRDNALAIAGLLSDHLGGPSVSPYQPAGLWDDVAVGADYEGTVYKEDKGEGLFRRSMYTFWKRTCPPPGLNTFDAPEREFCLARRSRTNTPLQALVLLNDPTYLEAARKVAERAIHEGGATFESRLDHAFRLSVARHPSAKEIGTLKKTYEQRLAYYQQDAEAAKSFLSVGESIRDESINPPELAAWTSIMSLILNLDEVITKG